MLNYVARVNPKKILKNLNTQIGPVIPAKAGIHGSYEWIPAKNLRE